MTPKEKAEDLVDKFDTLFEFLKPKRYAIQCAIITVIEIISGLKRLDDSLLFDGWQEWEFDDEFNYYLEVKAELEKL